MRIKIAVVGTFMMNLFFGQLCMMPMAYAQLMPMEHDEAMEMIMTPVETMTPAVLMSSAYCEHCVRIHNVQPAPMSAGCAGYCLSRTENGVAAMTSPSPLAQNVVALPSSIPAIIAFADTTGSFIDSTAPPLTTSLQRGIVLLE